MGPRVRARDGARREESEVVPGHGADLLRRRAMNLTRCGRGLAGRSQTGPTWFPRALRCVERGFPSTPGRTRRPRSSPHGIRTGSNHFRAERHFRNLGCPPQGELASFRLDHRPHGTPFADHAESKEIAVEGESLVHVIDGEEDVTDVLDDSHGPAMVVRRYMKSP